VKLSKALINSGLSWSGALQAERDAAEIAGRHYTAGEIEVIRKSSIFIAGTSAVPGKS